MVFSLPEYTKKLQIELRQKSVHNQTLVRVHLLQKTKIEELTNENKRLKKELKKSKKENDHLKQKIEQITKTNNRYRVSLFDHGNFKNPVLSKDKKLKGGQKGHINTNKDSERNYATFEKQRIFTNVCGNCGKDLSRCGAVKDKVLMDIKLNTAVLNLIIQSERQWCSKCHKEVRACHPQTLPFTEYGINTFMTIMSLRFKGKESFLTITSTLNNLFGLSISKSGVGSLLKQAKEYLKETYEELKKEVRKGNLMYNDETGWLVNGRSAWMWIMASEDKTVYVAAESRGKGIMEEIYGNSNAYSMHDGYGAYTNTVPKERQLYCWAHFLRFVHEETILSSKGSLEEEVKIRLVNLYQTIRSHAEYSRGQKEQFLTTELEAILALAQDNQTIKNILFRLNNQKEGLIRALLVTKDGTNNMSERELRPLAISRKISFGSNTFGGMETTAILASITQTISRDKTKQFIPTITSYLQEGVRRKYPQHKHIPIFVT